MPRTFIAEATMFINLLKAHLENIEEGGILCFLDLEKAFDKVSWRYLHEAIKATKFTDPFRTWMKALYDEDRKPKRKVYANGYLSREYRVGRGTAQGCPLSPLAFLFVIEGLTRHLLIP